MRVLGPCETPTLCAPLPGGAHTSPHGRIRCRSLARRKCRSLATREGRARGLACFDRSTARGDALARYRAQSGDRRYTQAVEALEARKRESEQWSQRNS